ncbi:MAG: PucR family transcriptional regulator [Clostridia bacterium]|nr:PucR family transcriptional regulator [Clostridia bacterium]
MSQLFLEFQNECLQELTNGANLSKLCNLTAKYTGNPIAVTLTSQTIVAVSKDYDQELVNEYVNTGKHTIDEEFTDLVSEFERLLLKGQPISKVLPFFSHRHSSCGCLFGINLIGVMDMPIVNHMPTKDELEILRIAASFFGLALTINGFSVKNNFHPIQNYMLGLLNNNINIITYQNPYYLQALLKDICSFRLLLVRPTTYEQESRIESELLQFCRTNLNWWYIPYNHAFVVVIAAENLSHLPALVQRLGSSFMVCVSDDFYPFDKFPSYIRIAEFALDISAAEGSQESVVYTDDYKVFFAAAIAKHSDDSELFESSFFRRIKDYDERYSASYVDTLRAFFRCNQDTQKMAEKLFIHKNTVFYRLNRMKELFDIDYQDVKQLSNLYFSLLADDNII